MSKPESSSRLAEALKGSYRIEGPLGEGGMATVYLAEDLKHERKVAVKVLKPELAAVLGGDRFLTEIKTTANLQHPHILPLFDSGEAEGFLFYVMPYVEGESLRDRLDRERQLPVQESIDMAVAIASALDYAHRHDVIHRDIKPENILLHEGNPVVADFGIALAVSAAGGGRMTETGLSLGTPHYMSPEQATADRDLTARSDVYALACVLYEMLTGDPPHIGPTPQAILMRILTEDPRPATDVRRSVPANVSATLSKALEKLPADRFESAEEFGRALRDEAFTYLQPEPTTGTSTVAANRRRAPGAAGAWAADHRSRWALGAIGVLAITVALQALRPNPTSSGDVGALVTRVEIDVGELPVPEEMAVSPDGSLLVFASVSPEGVEQLFVRRMDDLAIQPIPDTEGGHSPRFSPDGEWIAFVVGTEMLKVPSAGGRATRIVQHSLDLGRFDWGDDGTIVFTGPRGLYTVPSTGGEATQILPGIDIWDYVHPQILPSGRAVIFTDDSGTRTPGSSVALVEVDNPEVVTLVEGGSDARYIETGHLVFGTFDQALFAVEFDTDALEVVGPQVPILDRVSVGGGDGLGHFGLSRSGTIAYAIGSFNAAPEQTLVTLDLEGREEPLRLPLRRNYSAPRYSPDGDKLAYQESGNIWIYDLVLGSRDSVATGGRNRNPIWTPDGSRLAYNVQAPDSGALVTRPTDLSEPSKILLSLPGNRRPTAWTADGERLVYYEASTGLGDLWILDADSTRRITPYLRADGWDENALSISPNGRWAAYESNEDGRYEIYVRSFPEPGPRMQMTEHGGLGARWTADGEHVFYRNGDTVKVATVRAEDSFEVVSHETIVVGPYRGIDPHPDGTHFVAIKRPTAPEEGTPEDDRQLLVVINWLAEMRARLAVN